MTPQEFVKLRAEQEAIIKAAQEKIDEAEEQAHECPPPTHTRPAVADDIVPNAVIWYLRDKYNNGDYWTIVEEPLHYGDAFKAYIDHEGCRYGLEGAYVEVSPPTQAPT